MDLGSIDIAAIVKKVTQTIQAEHKLLSGIQGEDGAAVAVVTGYVPAPEKCRELLIKTFGNGIDCLLFHDCNFSGAGLFPVRMEAQDEAFFKRLERAEKIALVAPGVALMKRIAQGEDECLVSRAILRSLLWGAKISVVLDFVPPRFARNTFFEKIVDTVDALRAMDIEILEYQCRKQKNENKLSLVTERDVYDAQKAGADAIECMKNAIVTPLGREALKETGLRLIESVWE